MFMELYGRKKDYCQLREKGSDVLKRCSEAVQQPEKVAIMHCWSHQKGNDPKERGSTLADCEAKQVAEGEVLEDSLIPDSKIQVDSEPRYSKEDWNLINDLEEQVKEEGWAVTSPGKIVIPTAVLWALVMTEHRKTHWGAEALYKFLTQQVVAQNMYTTVKQVTQQCEVCLQNNPRKGRKIQLGQIGRGNYPGQQ